WTVPEGSIITSGATGPENNQITVSFGSTNGDITVTETNAASCIGATKILTISLAGCGLNADFTGVPLEVCEGSAVTFTNTSTGTTGSTTYSWDFGAGAVPATANTIGPHEVTYSTSGLKTITLIITDGASDSETKTDYITVTPSVAISPFSPAVSTRCQGPGTEVYSTTATNSTGITYSLDAASLAGGNTINASTGEVTYSATWSGTTTITASAAGCNGPAVTTHVVTVNDLPAVTASNNGPVCIGTSLTLTGGPNGMATYAWTGPNGFSSSDQNPLVSASATLSMAGEYTLTVTDGNGCVNSAVTEVTINTLPTATASNNGPVCGASPLSLTGGPNGMSTYAWTGPNGFTSSDQSPLVSASATLSMAGEYTLTVTDGNGCQNSAVTQVTVNALPVTSEITGN
ncbi:MAG: hypothetical protein LC655_07865, partial [Bacteroidales bacterium]|nr:hypothetical protein [Bacteroidales bacterium]